MMKTYYFTIISILLLLLFVSCEKDNLDMGPNAAFFGEIRDVETQELVEQDILKGLIYYYELGWNNAPVQSMNVKSDGTFRNNFMFAGNYKIMLERGNYVPQDTIEMKINKGDNNIVFEVLPYIRIEDVSINLVGNQVIAKFKMDQMTMDPIKRISLFAHNDITVSESIQRASINIDVNTVVDRNQEYQVIMDLSAFPILKSGKSYYFRIGALSSAPEARYNYVSPVDIKIP